MTVVRPSSIPASATSRAELVQILSLLVGVGATVAVNPDPVISQFLTQAAHLYRLLYEPSPPPPASSSSFAPAAYVGSVLSSAGSYVSEQAIKLQMRQRLMEFDEHSPVDHRTLSKVAIGLLAFATTRALCRAAMR